MYKISLGAVSALLLAIWNIPTNSPTTVYEVPKHAITDSLPNAQKWPKELSLSHFAGADITPSPACLAVAATGEVYVGVDMMGSLGKEGGKGKIVRLVDANQDGKIDSHTVFALVDNPRGIVVNDDKVYVLHTTFSSESNVANGMELVVFEDKNRDGIADGPSKPLIQHISNPTFVQRRGTDHATNGIRMGIDGWLYIAVGDFGFYNAIDREGTKLTMLGGGIVRVRPDGTEMEVYTHGLRNVYDLAIDPFMNIFARGNTNDGGGWNIRFSHQLQTGEYGYPVLFKNFTEEIIPALADLGGGSGTGALYMDDDRWPAQYNKVPMMADWGRNHLYIHRVKADGASYQQAEEHFIELSQITDLDVDANGSMYLSAWDGAGYSGNPDKGFIVRAVPTNWKPSARPNFKKATVAQLATFLLAKNGVTRLAAQQELLKRPAKEAASATWRIVTTKSNPLESRVAAMYTYIQITQKEGTANLLKLVDDEQMKEYAIRALADRKAIAKELPTSPFVSALQHPSERIQAASIIALGRIGKQEAIQALLDVKVPASFVAPTKGTEGPHATPNAPIILPHLAVKALVELQAVDACVAAIGAKQSTIALWALRYMHDERAVAGLINAYQKTSDESLQQDIITTLGRLYNQESPYDASWWWGTRPDTRGPYYKPTTWASSPTIKEFILKEATKPGANQDFFAYLNTKLRMGIDELGGDEEVLANEEVQVDLEKIKNKKGQVGEAAIEDVMIAMQSIKGSSELGKKLFVTQGCVACHSISKGEIMKGPFMGQIGSIMTREQIAESILKPDASISQGFASTLITAKGDKSYMGFITEETDKRVVLRDIAGQVYNIRINDIIKREELPHSMMPAGLANALSYEEFASLITFLSEQKQ